LQQAYDKISFEKGLLTNEKRKIKEYKTGKVHKFFRERKR